MYSRGLGAPGTRVTKTQTEGSEIWLYLKQAVVGALAADFVLACLLVILICLGWPSLVVFSVAGMYTVCWLLLNRTSLWLVVDRAQLMPWQRTRLVWAFVISMTAGALFFSKGWWEWLLCTDILQAFVLEITKPLRLSIWIYAALAAIWFLGAVKKIGVLMGIFVALMLALWVAYGIDYSAIQFGPLVQRLRYLAIPLLCPWVVFGLLLAIIMIKEIMMPNANFILSNIDWADYREAGGLWGLWLPGLFGQRKKKVIEGRVSHRISVRNRTNAAGQSMQTKRRELFTPKDNVYGLAQFAVALFSGRATFSERGSRTSTAGGKKGMTQFGYTQDEWERFKATALELELIKREGNKNVLTPAGVEALASIVERTWPGENRLPKGYRDILELEDEDNLSYETLPFSADTGE